MTSSPTGESTSRNANAPSPRYKRLFAPESPAASSHSQGRLSTRNRSRFPSPSKSATATPLPIVSGNNFSPALPEWCTKSTPVAAVDTGVSGIFGSSVATSRAVGSTTSVCVSTSSVLFRFR